MYSTYDAQCIYAMHEMYIYTIVTTAACHYKSTYSFSDKRATEVVNNNRMHLMVTDTARIVVFQLDGALQLFQYVARHARQNTTEEIPFVVFNPAWFIADDC